MFGNTYKCTSYNLFKFFGYFPAYGALSLRTEMLGHLPQSLYQTVGRFVKNHCSMFLRKALQQALATLFLGKEALETEFVAGKAAVHKCRNQGGVKGRSGGVGWGSRAGQGGSAGGGTSNGNGKVGGKALTRRSGAGTAYGESLREKLPRRVENFRFDPNTASLEDLERLGFSVKQAQSIVNYREKGGRFRRKEDFRKSYVVADSVYERLEAYIDIPLLDINKADSAQFDALPGIGGYFARKMVQQRKALGGYSHTAQLLDIHKFDRERYDALSTLICCSQPKPYGLWTLPADSLRLHPYIRSYAAARSIVFFREHNPREKWSVQALFDAGILSDEQAEKLSRCNIAAP